MWVETINEKPPIDESVDTMNSSGDIQKLKYKMNLWWLQDESMYVYYTPVKWYKKEN